MSMTNLFIKILSMSLTASYCIIFVCAARLLLKKAPRIFSYLLWIVVAFRLICPVSFESGFSLVGTDFVPNIEYEMAEQTGEAGAGIEAYRVSSELEEASWDKETAYNNYLNHLTEAYMDGTETALQNSSSADFSYKQILENRNTDLQALFFKIASYIWLIGSCLLAIYGLFTYIRLQQKIKVYARKISSYHSIEVWQVKGLDTPFVLGFFKAAIYLPEGLSEKDCMQCLAHEYTHIRRKDHLIKQMAFLLVCVYWFNPLVWLAFYLMSKDMEMSCDEIAIKSTSLEDRKAYSGTLLELSSTTKYFSGCPLAFGANSTKARIKHIMNYKRPSFWVMILAVMLVIVCVVGLSANPKAENEQDKIAPKNSANTVLEDANIPVDNSPNDYMKLEEKELAENKKTEAYDNDGFVKIDTDEFSVWISEESLEKLSSEDKYDKLYQLNSQLEELNAEIEELNQEKSDMEDNKSSLEETLKLEKLSEDKTRDFQEQISTLELKIKKVCAQLTALETEKEVCEMEMSILLEVLETSNTNAQYRLFAKIYNPKAGASKDYIVLAYDTFSHIDDAYSQQSMPESAYSSSIVKKLQKGDIVEVLPHEVAQDIPDELASKYSLICWEPDKPSSDNCGYVKTEYLNLDIPLNSLTNSGDTNNNDTI